MTFSLGVAIFAMFFGAGNIIFTLALGSEVGSNVNSAFIGLFITAIFLPLIGLISTILFQGDYKKFFNRTGGLLGFFLAMACMLLLGPFGAIPRCAVTSFFAIKRYIPILSLFHFSIVIFLFIFAFSYRHELVMDVLGKFLGPLKLIMISVIVLIGILRSTYPIPQIDMQSMEAFIQGCHTGYITMDLLGTFFFAGLFIENIERSPEKKEKVLCESLKACYVGALILSCLYIGFCYIAAMYGPKIDVTSGRYEFLNSLAPYILGDQWGFGMNIAIAISCFITAIALTALFASYLQSVFQFKNFTYVHSLIITIVISICMTNLGFESIMENIYPVILVCYPVLIVLSVLSLVEKKLNIQFVKIPVFATFLISIWNVNLYSFKSLLNL